jgi:glycosyltransferase involved in cell wall biosynthesis
MLIIQIGISGFPGESASIKRTLLTLKSLEIAGCNTLIINKHSVSQLENARRINRSQGIPCISTSFLVNRPDNFIIRNLNKFTGYVGELFLLVKKRKQIHTAIFYESSFLELVYYRILSKILRFNIIIQYVELRSSITYRRKSLAFLNDLLFDNYCFFLCDGIIVISEFLKERVFSKNKSLPLIKIPAINDFDEFNLSAKSSGYNYIMYCGSLGYMPVIDFILELYYHLYQLNLYNGNLLLAIGAGSIDNSNFKFFEDKIKKNVMKEKIVLKRNVPHHELIQLYMRAELLIVPMRNSLQDIAGFHHKVGEYTASAKPIISNNIGELKYYFKDGVSAILADEYSLESYLVKLSESLSSKDKLDRIAENGHQVGLKYLNYKNYSIELKDFILNI